MAMTWNDYLAQIAANPGAYQKFTLNENASSNPFATTSYEMGPMDYYFGEDPNDPNKLQLIAPGENGSAFTKSIQKQNGLDPWMALPFAGVGLGMLAAGGLGGLGGAAAAGATEGAGGFAALPAGGMTATGAAAPWATTTGGLGTLGSGTYGATTAGIGSAMGTTGGALGTGLGGITTAGLGTTGGSMFGLDNLFSGGDMLGKALDFATSKGGSALIGGLLGGSSSGPDNLTATSQNKMDPRMDPYVYGQNGILPSIMGQLGKQQSPGLSNFGANIDDYLNDWGADTFRLNQQAAQKLQGSNITAPQVNAPSQNNINLSPAYQDMIYGEAGANPYLTGAIQKGINQSTNAFGNYLTDATKATTDQLANIRGGAVVNGALGGSRQGIAEGRALSDLSTNLARAASQFGQNNTDAAVSAQAGAYDADRNRALSAMSGLNGSQYQTALTNAQLQADTNRLNSQNQIAGVGLSSGLLDKAYGYGMNNDQYDMNNIKNVSGLLSGYTGLNGSTTQSQPLYQNTTGNVLGGAMAGLGLWNAFNGKN